MAATYLLDSIVITRLSDSSFNVASRGKKAASDKAADKGKEEKLVSDNQQARVF